MRWLLLTAALLSACGGGGPVTSQPDAAEIPDSGRRADAGPDAGAADADPPDVPAPDADPPDVGPTDIGPPPEVVSNQLGTVRVSAVGVLDPPVLIDGALVTYVLPGPLGVDPGGFFVQAQGSGPALFVAVDTDALSPNPVLGDQVRFEVVETERVRGQLRVVRIQEYRRTSQRNVTDTLARDLSLAEDIVTELDAYESRLVRMVGITQRAYRSDGPEHRVIQVVAMSILKEERIELRLPEALIAPEGLTPGCSVDIGPTPMWRDGEVAQFAAWADPDIRAIACQQRPRVVNADSSASATVEVHFSRPLRFRSVVEGHFVFEPPLGVRAAAPADNVVVLTTDEQTPGIEYVLTVNELVEDNLRRTLDPDHLTARFVSSAGARAPAQAGELVITEIMTQPLASAEPDGEWFEVYNTSSDTLNLRLCEVSNEAHGFALDRAVVMLPGTYAVLARAQDVGFTPSTTYRRLELEDTRGEVRVSCGGVLIDEVRYEPTRNFPGAPGASISLEPTLMNAAANNLGASWCLGREVYATAKGGGSDRGTPGQANPSCVTPPDAGVVPDAGGETDAGETDAASDGGVPDASDGGVGPDA